MLVDQPIFLKQFSVLTKTLEITFRTSVLVECLNMALMSAVSLVAGTLMLLLRLAIR